MSRVDISSAGFSKSSLPNGMLQTDNALSTTLQVVKDNLGNSSTLLLSTVDAQVNSTFRIHTDSAELLDIEDTGSNNRFNINRDVQKINLDFASKPTDVTTRVGAIRTATNGSTLADVLFFREDGKIGAGAAVNANFPNTIFVSSQTSTGDSHSYNMGIVGEGKADSTNANTWGIGVYGAGQSSGGTRGTGVMGDGQVSNSADTGSAVGVRGYALSTHAGGLNIGLLGDAQNGSANYALYMNSGNIFSNTAQTWTLPTSTTALNIASNLLNFDTTNYRIGIGTVTPLAKTHIVGNGSTSATQSLLIKNSTGIIAFQVNDDLTWSSVNGAVSTQSNGALNANYLNAGLDLSWSRTGRGNNLLIDSSGTINASARLQVNSTTQGFLPPRMTNAQRTAIASPAVGLMVYCTDAVEGLYIYKSTGWTFVI